MPQAFHCSNLKLTNTQAFVGLLKSSKQKAQKIANMITTDEGSGARSG